MLMLCPYCGSATKVTNSRSHNDSQAVWRRRQCKACQAIWTTDEQYDLSKTHQVSYGPQTDSEPFERDILFMSIWKALQHRKTALRDATALTSTIITKVLAQKSQVIDVVDIASAAHDTLKQYDQVAASVYQASHTYE